MTIAVDLGAEVRKQTKFHLKFPAGDVLNENKEKKSQICHLLSLWLRQLSYIIILTWEFYQFSYCLALYRHCTVHMSNKIFQSIHQLYDILFMIIIPLIQVYLKCTWLTITCTSLHSMHLTCKKFSKICSRHDFHIFFSFKELNNVRYSMWIICW